MQGKGSDMSDTKRMLSIAMSMLFAGLFVGCFVANMFVAIYHNYLLNAGTMSQQFDTALRVVLLVGYGFTGGFAVVGVFFGVVGSLEEDET